MENYKNISVNSKIDDVGRVERGLYTYPFSEREYCVFDLDNAHWCYGEQIDDIV